MSQEEFVVGNLITAHCSKVKQQRKLTFGYLNARTVNYKTRELCEFVNDTKSDILCISEIWLTGNASEDIFMQGYDTKWI